MSWLQLDFYSMFSSKTDVTVVDPSEPPMADFNEEDEVSEQGIIIIIIWIYKLISV